MSELLLMAVQLCYRKHWLNDERIGWQELGTFLYDALAETMGDDEFVDWLKKTKKNIDEENGIDEMLKESQ